jgi:hypothetical protein
MAFIPNARAGHQILAPIHYDGAVQRFRGWQKCTRDVRHVAV